MDQAGVNVDNDFEPYYVVPRKRKKTIRELKAALKQAEELIIATDEDREGEKHRLASEADSGPWFQDPHQAHGVLGNHQGGDQGSHCPSRDIDDNLVAAQKPAASSIDCTATP